MNAPWPPRTYSIRKARMGSTDAARRAGKMAAAKVIVAIPPEARTLVRNGQGRVHASEIVSE